MQWFYANGAQSQGPVDQATLLRLQEEGVVTGQTLIWCQGMARWQPLAEISLQVADAGAAPAVSGAVPTPAAGADDPYRAPGTAGPVTPASHDVPQALAAYAAVVGPNFPIYRGRWRLDLKVANASGTWHWPGFLFGVTWMMYRKMYRMAAIWVAVLLATSVLESVLHWPPALSLVITLALSIVVGVMANSWYLAHCQQLMAEVRVAHRGSEPVQLRELARRGGTSVAAAVGALLVTSTLAFGLGLLLDA